MLTFNLAPIFKARGIIRPFTFLVKAGFSPHSANLVLNSKTRSFKLDHIELLCKVLVCDPHDLLLWAPDKDQQYISDHPLFKLKQQENMENMKKTLATIPYNQLKEITQQINKDS